MEISKLEIIDLPELTSLQPPDWQDILPSMRFYIDEKACIPLKITNDKRIIAVGAAIIHGSTGWLAQIIVHNDFRGKGLGEKITRELMDLCKDCETILLIATSLGYPVYKKLDFIPESDYLFFRGGKYEGEIDSRFIISDYDEKYDDQILAMDKKISGEDRKFLLVPAFSTSKLIIENNKLIAFYLPDLKEGPILSEKEEAGIALMQYKYSRVSAGVVPEQNKKALHFLSENNFEQWRKGTRMYIGKKVEWKPEFMYSRISGAKG